MRSNKIQAERLQEMFNLYDNREDLRVTEIAKICGMSSTTIYKHLYRRRIERQLAEYVKEITELRARVAELEARLNELRRARGGR